MALEITILDKKLDKKESAFEFFKGYKPKYSLLEEVIRCEQMNLRTGNAHTKIRSEVRGGGKKPWRQKGTGRARHGSTRSPIWVGGGVTFGPRNTRNWHKKINKSAKLSALKTIFFDKLDSGSVYQFKAKFDFPKTKDFVELSDTAAFPLKSTTVIYTTEDKPKIQGLLNTDVSMLNATQLKVVSIAKSNRLIMTPAARKLIEERLQK